MDKVIVLIQNNDEYEEFLHNLLTEQGYIVKRISSDLEILNNLDELNPDLIISSYNLPNVDAQYFYQKIVEDYPDLHVIFISMERDISVISAMLSFPTCEFLVKPVVPEELLARVKVLTTPSDVRLNKKAAETIKIKDLVLNQKTKRVSRGGEDVNLTPKEFSLLEYLMVNKNTVLSRESILNRVWGTTTDVSDRIVDVYIGYLREKIDANSDLKLIETVPGFGYSIKG